MDGSRDLPLFMVQVEQVFFEQAVVIDELDTGHLLRRHPVREEEGEFASQHLQEGVKGERLAGSTGSEDLPVALHQSAQAAFGRLLGVREGVGRHGRRPHHH
ncbi:hypothetical protein [Streptomyces ossamyceticus]|uniref:hypothetical protein n=1 Tax=Streptomyces ossamyceticus TaxID=249581 RepID=UPI000F46BCAA